MEVTTFWRVDLIENFQPNVFEDNNLGAKFMTIFYGLV